MIGVDTNVLLRYLLKDDAAQARRAERELERDDRFLIDGIVLCELVWVLETGYGLSRAEVVAALERIVATAQFEIEGKDLVLAALDDFRRSATDFSDCLKPWPPAHGPPAGQAVGIQGQYFAIAPASTRRSRPVIISASSEARKTAARA